MDFVVDWWSSFDLCFSGYHHEDVVDRLVQGNMTMVRALALVVGVVLGSSAWVIAEDKPYQSPYRVEFTVPPAELVGDLDRTERGDPHHEAQVPFAEWYSATTQKRWRAWGPPARHYPSPVGMEDWSIERKRERMVAIALRFEGYTYQHHHIPDWSPPPGWPWLEVGAGKNARGVDCSNLTGFVVNQGFGLRISTDIHDQAEQRVAQGLGKSVKPLQMVELPSSYEERLKTLRTGDLLFIRSRAGAVSHVVIWVGSIGKSPDGTPLVLDSHGADTKDSNGVLIPDGVHLRPFRKNSWYNGSASHALRLWPD